jgi:3-oxoacyl-[acyl-carrier-protein] synthase II
VVVTGVGLVTPHGSDVEAVWRGWLRSDTVVAPPSRVAPGKGLVKAVGEVPAAEIARLRAAWDGSPADLRTLFGVEASRRAFEDAGLSPGAHPRIGVAMGPGPGVHRLEDFAPHAKDASFDALAFLESATRIHAESLLRNPTDRPATESAKRLGLGGPVLSTTTACTAGAHAVGAALRAIRSGRADAMLAGGADSLEDPIGLAFFVLLRAAASEGSAQASRPFSRRRTGIVTGEGAGVAVLEEYERAKARGARIYAEVAGFGSTLDAHHLTAPRPDGTGLERAMESALADGGMTPDDVGFVSAHATGTKLNDPAEAQAIRRVLGTRGGSVPVTSGKASMGHLLAAAAGVSFVGAALALARGEVPPTAHLVDPDPACALDHVVGEPRRGAFRGALVNALAFGGHNASIALRRAE